MPWIRRNSETLRGKGKVLVCHCDGENLGLMNLIKFQSIIPGKRLILGIADTTPPNAVFDRLVRIGERVEKEGGLPLKGGAVHPASGVQADTPATLVKPNIVEDETFQIIRSDILPGDQVKIKQDVQELLEKGVEAQDILDRGMLPAMEVISNKFKTGKLFIPEVLLSARAMNSALPALEPYLAKKGAAASGRVLIGTVQGDLHNIGKNMVVIMLRGAGFQVEDMGVDVSTEEIVRQVAEYRPDILGLSALLTTTMLEMGRVIEALTQAGLRNQVKIIVGGAPVNEKFARDIGADGYARDCSEAVISVNRLLGK